MSQRFRPAAVRFREGQAVVVTSSVGGDGGSLASEWEVRPASFHYRKPIFSRLFKVKGLIEVLCDLSLHQGLPLRSPEYLQIDQD